MRSGKREKANGKSGKEKATRTIGHGKPAFETAKELQTAISDYFANGVRKKQVIVGRRPNQEVVLVEVPTITGLCHHLGLESRQSFYDMENRPALAYTIKRARLYIEQLYEEQLQIGNVIGAIFALKNFGWTDKQEHEHVGPDGGPIKNEWTITVKRVDDSGVAGSGA